MKLTPLSNRLVVRPEPVKEKTSGGIILPSQAVEKPQKGEVLAAGDDPEMIVKKGDNVLYAKGAGSEIDHDGETVLIMREQEVYAVV